MNDLVPSIGSSTHWYPDEPTDRPELLAEDAVVRKSLGDPFSQQFFRRPIGRGHRRGVGLEFDHQVAAAEVAPASDRPPRGQSATAQFEPRLNGVVRVSASCVFFQLAAVPAALLRVGPLAIDSAAFAADSCPPALESAA